MSKFYFLILFAIGLLAGCSGDGGNEPLPESIELSADKKIFTADGKDEVTFSVKDDKGQDVTGSCKFKIDKTEQASPVFKTDKPGTYKVVAIYAALTSNEISLVAFDKDAKVTIKSDKTEMMADGKDMVSLTLSDEQDSDVTEFGEFYADGVKLDGRYFKTTTVGKHQITATWNSQPVEGTLEITASAEITFTGRALVETMVSTSCQYCVPIVEQLTTIAKENAQVVLISAQVGGPMYNVSTAETQKDAKALYQALADNGGTPRTCINHKKENYWGGAPFYDVNSILAFLPKPADVAIAIENSVQDGELTVAATIASKRSFTGKAVAVLLENGVKANWISVGMVEMYRMMRDYAPDTMGESITLTAGTTTPFSVKIPLHDYKQQNCWVIVFIVGENGEACAVQHTPINRNIGY